MQINQKATLFPGHEHSPNSVTVSSKVEGEVRGETGTEKARKASGEAQWNIYSFSGSQQNTRQHVNQIPDGRWPPRLEARRPASDMVYLYFLSFNILVFEIITGA